MTIWLRDKVSSFVGGIVSDVKDLLGIHSPSTVFAGIGTNMGEGLGIGFLKAMTAVERDIKNAIPTEINVTRAGRSSSFGEEASNFLSTNSSNLSNPGITKMRGDKGIIQNITINSPTPLTSSEIARQIKNASRQMALDW